MTTPVDRAEINRRNARKSTGPRTAEGKARSRFNAVKHGCRATQPILPGEDPEVYQKRLEAWVEKFAPRDAVEHYLVERAVHVSWQLDRADRAEVAQLAADLDREADDRAKHVAKLGADLFRIPAGRLGADGTILPARESDNPYYAARSLLSAPLDPEDDQHPARLGAELEATAAGCDWLRDRWAELGRILDEGRAWRPADRLRAIRLLGKQPLDLVADRQVLGIYLAGRAMEPNGPDVFAEPLGDLCRPETSAMRDRLAARFAAEKPPRHSREARASLRAIVTAAMARVEALGEVRAAVEAAGLSDISARLSYDARQTVEWLHKHQATCGRALFRTFEELRRFSSVVRGPLSVVEAEVPRVAPPSSPLGPAVDREAPPTPSPAVTPTDPAGPGADGSRPEPPAPEAQDPSESESEPEEEMPPTPASASHGPRTTDHGQGKTNEASRPPAAVARLASVPIVMALALLAIPGPWPIGRSQDVSPRPSAPRSEVLSRPGPAPIGTFMAAAPVGMARRHAGTSRKINTTDFLHDKSVGLR